MMTGDVVQGILREERKRKHATQQQIADFLGVDRSTYTYYETGKLRVPINVLNQLAAFYELPVSAFFSEPDHRIAFYSGGTSLEYAGRNGIADASAQGERAGASARSLTFEEQQLLSQLRARVCCEDAQTVLQSLVPEEICDGDLLAFFADPDL